MYFIFQQGQAACLVLTASLSALSSLSSVSVTWLSSLLPGKACHWPVCEGALSCQAKLWSSPVSFQGSGSLPTDNFRVCSSMLLILQVTAQNAIKGKLIDALVSEN